MGFNEGLIRELSITVSGSRPIMLRSGSSIPTDTNYSTRHYLAIASRSPHTIYLGGSTVTSASGYPLASGSTINTFPGSIAHGDLYAVSDWVGSGSGGSFVAFDVRILEA